MCVVVEVGGEGVWEVGASASGREGLQRLQRQVNLLAELRRARQPRLARGHRLGVTRHDDVQLTRLAILPHHATPRHKPRLS